MIIGETVVELFDSVSVGPVLLTFVQYLITFRSRPDVASDVISGVFVGPIAIDKFVKISWS